MRIVGKFIHVGKANFVAEVEVRKLSHKGFQPVGGFVVFLFCVKHPEHERQKGFYREVSVFLVLCFQNKLLIIEDRFEIRGVEVDKLVLTGNVFRTEKQLQKVVRKVYVAGKIYVLGRVVLILAVLMVLPELYDKGVARFQNRLLFVEMVYDLSFGYDENFYIIVVCVVKTEVLLLIENNLKLYNP